MLSIHDKITTYYYRGDEASTFEKELGDYEDSSDSKFRFVGGITALGGVNTKMNKRLNLSIEILFTKLYMHEPGDGIKEASTIPRIDLSINYLLFLKR